MTQLAAIGVDAGSTTCKVVGVSSDRTLLDWRIEAAHPLVQDQVERIVKELVDAAQVDVIVPVVATGYGRKLVKSAALNITEITCHARGVYQELQTTGTLVDIGGQDTKVIIIGPKGKAIDFVMNDKCAAGTGRFLEHTAGRLHLKLEELGTRALATQAEERISSTCTVFAESEIISRIAHGADLDAIVRGLHRSLVSRVAAMVRSLGLKPPLMLSGGVAQNDAMQVMLSEALGHRVVLPKHPQLMGAYGAGLVGLDRL